MNKQTSNNSEVRAEQAAGKKYQTIKLGLDVHADTIVVVRILDNAAPQPAQKFKPAKFLQWVQSQLRIGRERPQLLRGWALWFCPSPAVDGIGHQERCHSAGLPG